jgi:hypothetical protein
MSKLALGETHIFQFYVERLVYNRLCTEIENFSPVFEHFAALVILELLIGNLCDFSA